jgi:hypothetical protein
MLRSLNLHCKAPGGRSFFANWHSKCCRYRCSTQPTLRLRYSNISTFCDQSRITRGRTFIQSAGTKIKAKIWFGPQSLAPLHEFVSAKLVRLGSKPRKFGSLDTFK